MKNISLALAVAGSLSALGAASPSLAQNYGYGGYRDNCSQRIHGSGQTGALVGGLAGAAVGANLAAHHGGRTGGALIGAAAGAALGNSIARSGAKARCRGSRYGSSASHYAYRGSPDYGYSYGPPNRSFGYGSQSPYYAQPYASGYDRYDSYGSSYAPRHRQFERDHEDDDDDEGDDD